MRNKCNCRNAPSMTIVLQVEESHLFLGTQTSILATEMQVRYCIYLTLPLSSFRYLMESKPPQTNFELLESSVSNFTTVGTISSAVQPSWTTLAAKSFPLSSS